MFFKIDVSSRAGGDVRGNEGIRVKEKAGIC